MLTRAFFEALRGHYTFVYVRRASISGYFKYEQHRFQDLMITFAGAVIFVMLLIIIFQDILIAPTVISSLFNSVHRDTKTLPLDTESNFITTYDGNDLEVWRVAPVEHIRSPRYVGIIFHGNAGSLEAFHVLQLWFQEMGIVSYAVDYRGFGKSSGWPSEQGFYADSDALWQYVIEREGVDPSDIVVLGYSLGGAMAARIASLNQPRVLVLVSAFYSIEKIIREHLFLRFLTPFSRYRLPTGEYVNKLESTHLLLVHGQNDSIVPVTHADKNSESYRGKGCFEKIIAEDRGHNDVFFSVRKELANRLDTML